MGVMVARRSLHEFLCLKLASRGIPRQTETRPGMDVRIYLWAKNAYTHSCDEMHVEIDTTMRHRNM